MLKPFLFLSFPGWCDRKQTTSTRRRDLYPHVGGFKHAEWKQGFIGQVLMKHGSLDADACRQRPPSVASKSPALQDQRCGFTGTCPSCDLRHATDPPQAIPPPPPHHDDQGNQVSPGSQDRAGAPSVTVRSPSPRHVSIITGRGDPQRVVRSQPWLFLAPIPTFQD